MLSKLDCSSAGTKSCAYAGHPGISRTDLGSRFSNIGLHDRRDMRDNGHVSKYNSETEQTGIRIGLLVVQSCGTDNGSPVSRVLVSSDPNVVLWSNLSSSCASISTD
jgi:hypothetical protein